MKDGIHVLVVDPFPPGSLDPHALHPLIWDEFDQGAPFELPAGEPLLLVSYRAAVGPGDGTPEAYIEPFRVGAELPNMPAWLDRHLFVEVPLEAAYQTAWNVSPANFKHLVEYGKMPTDERA